MKNKLTKILGLVALIATLCVALIIPTSAVDADNSYLGKYTFNDTLDISTFPSEEKTVYFEFETVPSGFDGSDGDYYSKFVGIRYYGEDDVCEMYFISEYGDEILAYFCGNWEQWYTGKLPDIEYSVIAQSITILTEPDDVEFKLFIDASGTFENRGVSSDTPTDTNGIYDTCYDLIKTYVYGGNVEVGTYKDLVCTAFSTLACLFVMVLPFLIVWLVIRIWF